MSKRALIVGSLLLAVAWPAGPVFAASTVQGPNPWVPSTHTAPIYSRNRPPTGPRLEDLPQKESISQYGIRWTFAQPARVGQFVNGDWYVVGPVTIKEINPKPL